MIDRTYAIYVENEVVLLCHIRKGAIYDENQTRQWRDPSYRCGLRQNENWMVETKQVNDMTYRIGLVYIKTKIEWSGPITPSAVSDEN